ncbi:histidine kinase (plasmid) [Pararobbsia alpina]|uniref:sensor histidine kinase n=1 Tax=Pararobbsia alpina TaxID=621374 RepID=UPI0039A6EEB1
MGTPISDAIAVDALLFERLPDPYLVINARLQVETANAACRALFGVGDAGFGSQQINRIEALAERGDMITALVEDTYAGRVRRVPVFRFTQSAQPDPDRSNASRYWQIQASLLSAADSRPPLVALRFDDVTLRILEVERERRERAQMRSHARLKTLLAQEAHERVDEHRLQFEQVLEFAGVGAWQLDLTTGTIACSERCRIDLAIEDVSGCSFEKLLGNDAERIAASSKAVSEGLPFEFEVAVSNANGHRWVLIRGMGRLNENSALRSVIGFTLDITARKEHELELDARADVERKSRERSEALARTMDEFVAAVSHELRSPLNAIVSWGELLHLVADPSVVARASEAIRRNGRQLSHMVDDLLDSGAVASGKLSVNLQPVDLGALTAIVVEDMRKAAEHKGLLLQATDISPCRTLADDSRMRQVISNLLTNAIKFTDAGRIDVSVIATDREVTLTVHDTGRGIEPEALPHVFDRFQQFADRPSGRSGGLGLGLWLVKQIVTLHQGTIDAASEGPNRGATFTVCIPIAASFKP